VHVGINTLTIEAGCGGGEEHYLRRVLATIRSVQPDIRFVLFTDQGNHDSFEGWDRVCTGDVASLERAIRKADPDLLFTPLRTALDKCPVPQVPFTLELMGRGEEPGDRPLWHGTVRLKTARRIAKTASATVVPSEFLHRKCLDLLDIPLDKVVVAPLGVDEAFGEPQPSIAQEPYILTVGNTHGFKNLIRLRKALAHLKDELPHSLIIVGHPCEAEPENWGSRVVRVLRCPAAHLAGLYQHCDLFVCPSLYEGSAVTVLEAMRAGAPVVASRVGAIPESAGDTPLYFNPESVSSIVAAIRRMLDESPADRERRTRFGKQIAAEYTWERCAWKTIAAFRHA